MTTAPDQFEVGKIYRAPRAIHNSAFLVTKVTRSERRASHGGIVPNDWVTFNVGFVRDGDFHQYDHVRPIRRKILSNYYSRNEREWCYERAEDAGARHYSRIEAYAEVKEEER